MNSMDEQHSEKSVNNFLVYAIFSYIYLSVSLIISWTFLDINLAIAISFLLILIQRTIGDQTIYLHNRWIGESLFALRNLQALALHISRCNTNSRDAAEQDFNHTLADADRLLSESIQDNLRRSTSLTRKFLAVGVEIALLCGCAYIGLKLSRYSGDVITWVNAFQIY